GFEDGGFALLVIERLDEGAAKIFLFGENTSSFAGPLANLGGIGAEERRCAGEKLPIDDGEIGGDMMAFNAPAPGSFWLGRAEDGKIVELRITSHCSSRAFDFLQDHLEVHDVACLGEAVIAQPGMEQGKGEVALLAVHVLDREAISHAQ